MIRGFNVNYQYNIRGWLTQINDINNLQLTGQPKDLFSFKLNYNTKESNEAGVVPLYNGNISEAYWKTNTDNVQRGYAYEYDNLNRLTKANSQRTNANHFLDGAER